MFPRFIAEKHEMNRPSLGILFALAAAALNATIGVISKLLMHSGLNSQDIAFLKTLIAVVLLSVVLWVFARHIRKAFPAARDKDTAIRHFWLKIAICAFLGIFVLFFFETVSYQYGNAADVVVVLMASAAVSALVFGRVVLGEKMTPAAIVGTALAVIGIFVISWSGNNHYLMLLNSMIAGCGYGLFSVLVKKFGLEGGIYLTRALLFFGLLYLAVPFAQTIHPISFSVTTATGLLALACLPTILGFYCTTKALRYMSTAKVQVTELSEPVFAMVLAWMFLQEMPTRYFAVGAALILSGIILINRLHRFF